MKVRSITHKLKFSDDTVASDIKDVGTIVADWFEDGIRFLIMRAPGSWTVYMGIPSEHPLAGEMYNDVPVDAHGGLTFSQEGGIKNKSGVMTWPAGYYWYGYDYAHLGDKLVFDALSSDYGKDDHDWTLGEVKKDTWSPRYSLKRLMDLAERIKKK